MPNMNIGKPFIPEIGKCYDLRFGKIKLDGPEAFCSARIRVKGLSPSQWENIDTGQPLDPRLGRFSVHAHREIAGP